MELVYRTFLLIKEPFKAIKMHHLWWFGVRSVAGAKYPFFSLKKGAKYYLEEVLQSHLLLEANAMLGDERYYFQQDSAPAHKAKIVQSWYKEFFPDFIPTEPWPASSPDANPLDFSIWGYMLSFLKDLKNITLPQFKELLQRIWDEIPMEVMRAACDNFPSRLRKIVKSQGERIEMQN